MKRKIAIIANGWYNKGLQDLYKGIYRYAEPRSIDVFMFLTYSQFRETNEYNKGEFNVYRLPDYRDFDGVIFVPGSLSSGEEAERIRKELVEANISAVSIGEHLEGLGLVDCDNYDSMKNLCEYLVENCDINSVAFMAGHRENDESNLRLAAAKEVLGKAGIKLDEKNTYYCNWEYSSVCKAAAKLAQKRKMMPDAILCANDYGAMAVCATLEDAGYDVPGDVIVTGFDNVDLSRAYSPSITTLAQPYELMGYGSMELIYEQIETGKVGTRNYSCELIKGESTGFSDEENTVKARKLLAQDNFLAGERNILFEWTNSNIENAFFKAKRVEDLPGTLLSHFLRFNEYEGDGFAVVIDDLYRQNIYNSDINLVRDGFEKNMQVVVGIDGDETYQMESFETRKIIPNYVEDSNSHLYLITSLHSQDNIFGYIVMKDAIGHVVDRSLGTYTSRLGELFEKYRKAMRLDCLNSELLELSVKDSLTGIYNRLGYERVAKAYFNDVHKLGRNCAILFIDLNRMKHINDRFGHLQGDMAIRTVATVITECIPNDWKAIRYGGDEFVIIGACDDEQTLKYICERISSTITKRGEELRLPYKLTASAGYMLSAPGADETLEKYVVLADEYMYKNKKRTYEEEEKK